MWQSLVEIEHYSIAYFDYIMVFEVHAVVQGSYVLHTLIRYLWTYTACMSPAMYTTQTQ